MALKPSSHGRPPDGATVVVSAAGTATAYGLARSLRDRWGSSVQLVGTDVNPPELVPAATLLDACERLPLSADAAFPAAIDAVLSRAPATVYVPLVDHEIAAAATRSLPAGTRLLGPGPLAAGACADKLAVARLLSAAGLPAAPTTPAPAAEWSEPGVVVKPRAGFGSRDVLICEQRARWERERDELTADQVVQPLLAGPEITIDAFAASDGAVRAVARERLEVRGGVATKARVREDAELAALAASVARALELSGTFCMQVMHDSSGRPAITDVNARPGGGTRMTVVAGVDLLCAPFAQAWGLPVTPLLAPLARERVVVRHWEEELR